MFVLLRGGFDGLAAVVPYGDPVYRSLRGAFAFDESELVDARRHVRPGAGPRAAARAVAAGRARRVHAMAIPYRTRSHFDGQAILETGHRQAGRIVRRLAESPAAGDAGQRSGIAIAVGHAALADRARTRCRRGRRRSSARSTTRIWIGWRCCIAPTRCCTAASKRRCSSRISSARSRWRGGGARRGGITPLMQAAAKILRQDGGPNIAADGVQRLGHARQSGPGGRRARSAARAARGRTDGVPHRHGRRRGRTRPSS